MVKRLWLALRVFWRILSDGELTDRAQALLAPAAEGPDLRLLAVLQREGRLVDFLMEELGGYSDAQVGAAARDIHARCRKALAEYVTIQPVVDQAEESPYAVPAGFDAERIRLVGNVAGTPPFRGILKHHGWVAVKTRFPPLPGAAGPSPILAPAEVELS